MISGESYAGVYVPLIAQLVVKERIVPLRGILVGNGIMDRDVNTNTYFPFIAQHGLLDPDFAAALETACQGSYARPPSPACSALMAKVPAQLGGAMFNAYDIYGTCASSSTSALGRSQADSPSALSSPSSFFFAESAAKSVGGAGDGCIATVPLTTYLNRADVKAALGVPDAVTWTFCNDAGNYTRNYGSLMPVYASLVGQIAVAVYNGDCDSVINVVGAQACARALGAASGVARPWAAWTTDDGQIAGYSVGYANNVTMITVKGAGHMVPTYKPAAALRMLKNFLGKYIL